MSKDKSKKIKIVIDDMDSFLDGFRQYIIETQGVAPDAYSQTRRTNESRRIERGDKNSETSVKFCGVHFTDTTKAGD
jgi:hypothetical protein